MEYYLAGDGRIHPNFKDTRTPSGRYAVSNPNLKGAVETITSALLDRADPELTEYQKASHEGTLDALCWVLYRDIQNSRQHVRSRLFQKRLNKLRDCERHRDKV